MLLGVAACVSVPLWQQQERTLSVILSTAVVIFSVGIYCLRNDISVLKEYLYIKHHKAEVTQLMNQLNTPEDIITHIEQHLAEHPNDGRGWYLMGKFYFDTGELQKAKLAFAKANRYNPHQVKILLSYAETLFYAGGKRLDQQSRALLDEVLVKSPSHPMALSLLALDAYQQQHYSQAIKYWEEILQHLDLDSDDATNIFDAIKEARKQIASATP